MAPKECIILAGGFGTRLQSVVKDVPKCMAEVADKPFLQYLFNYLISEEFNHVVLSLGYKSEVVLQWLDNQCFPLKVSCVIEDQPLGTGGAIKLAFSKIEGTKAFIINGDTFFNISSHKLLSFHLEKAADLTIALKPMVDFDRYGSVELDKNQRVISFLEKQHRTAGLINAGVYIVSKDLLLSKLNLSEKFSFEKDVMESHLRDLNIYGSEHDDYFIDIGIPSDFEKANKDFLEQNI